MSERLRVLACLAASLAFGAAVATADHYPRQPVDALHYDIDIAFAADFAFAATTRIDVRLTGDAVREVRLDLVGPSVETVSSDGRSLAFHRDGGQLLVDLGRTRASGEIVPVTVRYRGQPDGTGLVAATNAHGRPTLFADNWPEGARHWIPAIDHPSDKATVDFQVTAPERYDVVAPGRLLETRSLLDGRRLTRWSEAVPIPTYCMVVGVAEFDVAQAGVTDGVPVSLWSFPPDAEAAARKFARTGLALETFSALVAPFPYEKLAQVQSSARYGGVEYASVIFYAEKAVQGPDVREAPMPHEVAHQWWGDSVTPADWDDVWLSEGFATYFDAIFHERLEGGRTLPERMARAAEAIRKETAKGPGTVVDTAISDPAAKLNAFTYQKGAWVLHMLRRVLGDEPFFRGLREFYRLHACGNATTDDLRRVMEAATGERLDAFFREWVYRAGWPDLHVAWLWSEAGREAVVEIEQVQAGEPYAAPLDLAFRVATRTERRTLALKDRRQTVRFALPERPDRLEVDPDTWLLHTSTVTAR
jgi:aminopeptidase N